MKYASNPDWNKVIYLYNSNGKNIGRVGWEPTRWYIHGCGSDGHFNYLTPRQTTDKERTWTVTKSATHLNIYVEEVHLATIDFQANNCLDDYGGNVVSAVSFKYFATQSGSWREKPLSKNLEDAWKILWCEFIQTRYWLWPLFDWQLYWLQTFRTSSITSIITLILSTSSKTNGRRNLRCKRCTSFCHRYLRYRSKIKSNE